MTDPAPAARKTRPGLGRGLSALLGDNLAEEPITGDSKTGPGVRMLPVSSLIPDPNQPRRHFDEEALNDLAESIRSRGLIQPIFVRPHGHSFQIVAGERRWRAAQRARLHEVPVVVRELSDVETLEIALIENIQRQDLNAVEEAEGYARLIRDFGHTQEALGRIVHKSRSHIANLLRLLDLPPSVREMVVERKIEMGHARALIGAPDPEKLAREIAEKGLSVRDAERLARAVKPAATKRRQGDRQDEAGRDADLAALERHLGDVLGLNVRIAHAAKGGTITVTYSTLDQLDMVCQRLTGERI
jgi:ParB family transcriptional regulator, chromosome partitioning protein